MMLRQPKQSARVRLPHGLVPWRNRTRVLFFSFLLWITATASAQPGSGKPPNLSTDHDSLRTHAPDTLAADLNRPDPAPVERAEPFSWVRFADPLRDAAPDSLLTRPAVQPVRPVEDFADELLTLHQGPLYDQAQTGQRLLLAQDGLDPRESGLLLDGLDLGSRITGRTDLNLVNLEGLDPDRSRWWQRHGAKPGGMLELSALRAQDDSIKTRVRWMDGFLGYVRVEGDFRRPFAGGRALMSAAQTWTHERIPGAASRGNLFYWNFDRPLGEDWLLRYDQRMSRNKHNLLELDTDGSRSATQLLERGRLQRAWGEHGLLEADLWQLRNKERISRSAELIDNERIRSFGLRVTRNAGQSMFQTALRMERQDLESSHWHLTKSLAVSDFRWKHAGSLASLKRVLDTGVELAWDSDHSELSWNGDVRLDVKSENYWSTGILHTGQRQALPEAQYLERDPAVMDRVVSPDIRYWGSTMYPNHELDPTRWLRQELRLGYLGNGRWWRGSQLRTWRVALQDQPVEAYTVGPTGGVQAGWEVVDHVQSGATLSNQFRLLPELDLDQSISWYHDDGDYVSQEYPSLMLDAWLSWNKHLFHGELDTWVWFGLRHEYGGLDRFDRVLWDRPEFWLKISARRGPFTFWWALRNPGAFANPLRVEGLPLPGHEEILGIRWNFLN